MTTAGIRARTPLRPAAALLATALLAATAVACGAADADGDPHPDHRSFALTGTALTIETVNADLTLAPADVDQVQVERRIEVWKAGGSKPDISWSMSGSTLTLKVKCGWGIGSCSVHHIVRVPRDVAVTVRGDNSDISADGFSAPLALTSTNGDISASGETGPLELDATNGDIAATGVRSSRITARTTRGDLSLSFAAAPSGVRASATEGDVTVRLPGDAPGYHLDLHSTVGDINHPGLSDTAGSPRTISLTTTVGDINLLRDGG